MEKKLPSVFVNNSAKKIKTSNNIYYSLNKTSDNKEDSNLKAINNIIIQKKINDVFSSTRFVYKAKVLLTTKENGTTKEVLISKVPGGILTLSGKVVEYKEIIDIKLI